MCAEVPNPHVEREGKPVQIGCNEHGSDVAKSIAQEIVNQIPDLVEDLRDIAAQCSFANCRFNDVFQMAWLEALSCALDALVESGILPNWPESALGEWGIWLYCNI